ncbi:MAG: hypothetical protein Q7J35_10345 [Candidatus Methanoperedens sp.]|nr:hypothetical protein [Candidatus Methanoperedens sp.]
MPNEDFVEYKRREYCNDVKCPIQVIMNQKELDSSEYNELRDICKEHCLYTTYEFHHWLVDKGYLLLRPEQKK